MKQRIIIIGCGYGGVVSGWRLSAFRKKVEVTVIDRGRDFNFLPLLPDALGRKIPTDALSYPIANLSSRYGFNFLNEEVISLDLNEKRVSTNIRNLSYDCLIIASGSETNFYANADIKKYAYKLDDARDAQKIKEAIGQKEFDAYIIAGGGYTGVEIATNLRLYLDKCRRSNRIIIVERAPDILGPLPGGMKDYVRVNLRRLNIEVLNNTVVKEVKEAGITLSDGSAFNNSMLIWAAGVKAPDFIQKLDVEKNPQGRIKVDEYLRINDSCFVIGDASYFSYKGAFLRMAVQFAIAQANIASYNIITSLFGCLCALRRYQPMDVGYIIPMANNLSCGNVLGVNFKGVLPTGLHYFMSLYRAYGFRNKIGILKALLT